MKNVKILKPKEGGYIVFALDEVEHRDMYTPPTAAFSTLKEVLAYLERIL